MSIHLSGKARAAELVSPRRIERHDGTVAREDRECRAFHRDCAAAGRDGVRFQVPVPESVIGALKCQDQSFFARLQRRRLKLQLLLHPPTFVAKSLLFERALHGIS